MTALSSIVRKPGVTRASLALLGLGVMVAATSLQGQTAQVPAVDKLVKVGGGLYEVAVGESTDSVYVASTAAGNRKIFVLDPRTLEVKNSIDVEAHPAFGIAFNNRTHTLYTSNTRSNNVTAIDADTGKVLSIITSPDGGPAHGFRLLVDEESNLVYISLPGSPSRVWIIDGATNTLAHEITDVGTRSTGLALDRAGNRLFVASIGDHAIIEIDLATRRVTRQYPSGGQGTTHLVFDPNGNRLFAGHQQSGDVTVIDTRTGEVLKTIPSGEGTLGMDMDRKNNLLYVANRRAGTVTVINTTTSEVVTTLEAGTMPNTVAVDSRTGDVYVSFKARPTGRGGRGRGAAAPPAAPVAAPAPDEGGDTVARIVLR